MDVALKSWQEFPQVSAAAIRESSYDQRDLIERYIAPAMEALVERVAAGTTTEEDRQMLARLGYQIRTERTESIMNEETR